MLLSAILFSLFALSLSAPLDSSLDKRYTVLADGTSMQYGTTNDGSGLQWQSSGQLAQGGCKNSVDHINNCYHMYLTSDPNQMLDPGSASGNRQRIEFLTPAPGYPDGQIWSFQWKYFLSTTTGSGSHFFHTMQIFSRAIGNPVLTLDPINGYAEILNTQNPCSGNGCSSIPLSQYEGKTVVHNLVVKFGTSGKLQYKVNDLATGKTLLSYSYSGNTGSGGVSIKFGLYRLTEPGQTEATANVGDFTSKQLTSFP